MLTTTFAEIEERVHDMLLDLIRNDNILAGFFLERNGLDKNVKLLMEINKIEKFESNRLKIVVKRLDKIRRIRNSLIHGAWLIFPKKESAKTRIIVCTSEIKASFSGNNIVYEDKSTIEYTLDEVEKCVKEAFSILLEIEKIHSLLINRNSEEEKNEREI